MILSTNFTSLSIKETPPLPKQPTEKIYPFIKKIRIPKGKRDAVICILALRRGDSLLNFKINNINLNQNLVVNVNICKKKKEKTKEDISIIDSLPVKEIDKKTYKTNVKINCNHYLQISYLNTEATGIIEISGEYKKLSY